MASRKVDEGKGRELLNRYIQDELLLLQRAPLHPWEDLTSLISRTARRMGYEKPEWILHPEHASHSIAPKQLAYLRHLADYGLIEQLLLLDEETLYSLTLHRFFPFLVGRSAPPASHLHAEIKRPRLWEQNIFWEPLETQVCPQCLLEKDAYDRLYWRTRTLLICPRHSIYLQHRCPVCLKPIPALRSHPFLCLYCKDGDYRSSCEPIDPRDMWLYDTQVLLLEHLGVDHEEVGSTVHAQSLLRKLASWQYFLIMERFEELFVQESFATVVLQDLFHVPALLSLRLQPGERKSAFLFHWIVAEWPNHFFWLLEHIASLFSNKVHRASYRSMQWRESNFFLNPAFSASNQQQTFSLLMDCLHAYTILFPSRWGTHWLWGFAHTF